MRKLLLALMLTLLTPFLLAQNYSNEWINYSKNYYKLRINKDGLYRIPFSTLSQSGLSSLSGSGFKMYYKGKEIPIYVSTNGSLSGNDYVEFYGEKNDGEFDSQMFLLDNHQLTPESSLFTDSITYYLVWDSNGATQRFSNVANNISNPPAKEQYFMHTENKIHKNVFYVGQPERIAGVNYNFADFEKGEGFVSSIIQGQTSKSYSINTPAQYTGSGAPTANLETKVVGQNNDFFNFKDHHMRIRVDGTTYVDELYEGHDTPTYSTTILSSDITSPRTAVEYESVGDVFSEPDKDWQSVSYTKITYPRNFDFLEYSSNTLIPSKQFYFELNDNSDTYLEIKNFSGGSAPVLYDLTNNKRYVPTVQNGIYKIRLQAGTNSSLKRQLFMANTDASSVSTVSDLDQIKFTNYQSIANQGDYIMISHSSLRVGSIDWVQSYANYRSSTNGGGHKVVLADMEELYDQFAWGIPSHPLAIRNFINHAMDKWTTDPEYLFLVGKSIEYRVTTTPSSFRANLIPTYGNQPSDNMLGVRHNFDYRPQVGVGRISANTPTDVRNYFNKIQQYENLEDCTRKDRLWRKHALLMATGDNDNQYIEYEGFLEDYKGLFDNTTYFGGKVLDIQAAKNYSNNFKTRPFIEDGISVFTFMGHSTGQIWKTDILENPAGYNQPSPRFPMFISGSCFVGNIHKTTNSKPSMAEAYVLAENKGAIGFLATVSFGFPSTLDIYTRELYRQFTGKSGNPINQGKPIGGLIKNTLENIYIASSAAPFYEGVKATSEEFTFQGDPALVIGAIKENSEYIIENNYQYTYIDVDNGYVKKTIPRDDVQVFGESGSLLSSGDNLIEADAGEELTFRIRSTNLGKAVTNNYSVKISRRVQGSSVSTTLKDASLPSAKYESIHVLEIPYPEGTNQSATYEYIVKVDANNAITEDCEDNNEVILRVRYAPDACNGVAAQYENLSITNTQSTYCVNDPAIQLQSNIGGGSFKITQIGGPTYNVNVFQPSQLGGGQFIITYTVTDAGTGCVFSTEESVTIVEPMAAIQSIDLSDVCVGDEINVTTAPSDGEYVWNFGTAGDFNFTGTPANPTLSWNTPGEKVITLKVAQDGCESATIAQTINVYEQVPNNFPISCETDGNSIIFTWDAAGANSFNIIGNDVWLQQVAGNVNSYTFTDLNPDEEVTIKVIAVPGGTCNEVQSTLTCKAACAGETPTLDINSSYCIGEATVINPPMVNGVPVTDGFFRITLADGSSLNVSNTLSTSTLQVGNNTLFFEYTDADGCTYTSQLYTVSVTNPQVSISGNELLCLGEGEVVSLSVPETFSSYQWNVENANSFQLEVSEAGTYSVVVTDGNGCTTTDEFEVQLAVDPQQDIFTSGGNTTLCDDGTITLQAPFGYVGYIWSGNASNTSTLVISEPGDYFVDYEDNNGCIWRAEIAITGPQSPTIESNCSNNTYTLEAMGNYESYLWEGGSSDPVLTVTSGGTYNVTVTDVAGCTTVGAQTVPNEPFEELAISLSTGENNEICEGEEITISVTNTNATNITWATGETGNTITVDKAGVYIATADMGGCTKMIEQIITTNPASNPTAAFTLANDNICKGESLTFSNASTNASAYSWTFTNDTSGEVSNSTEENPVITFSEVGNYTIELVADAACGSKQATETVVTAFKVSDNPVVDISAEDLTICPGTSVTLTADGDATEYTWDDGEVTDAIKVEPIETTTYQVTAVNEAGCTETASITLDVEICNFDIPNVITPNNDSFNDYWHIPQVDAGNTSIYVEIYNRWGQKVYSAINYNNGAVRWDGRNDGGEDLPHATYYYVINLNDGTTPLTGHVTILR